MQSLLRCGQVFKQLLTLTNPTLQSALRRRVCRYVRGPFISPLGDVGNRTGASVAPDC